MSKVPISVGFAMLAFGCLAVQFANYLQNYVLLAGGIATCLYALVALSSHLGRIVPEDDHEHRAGLARP